MEEFTPYEMLEVAGNKFILVHGGIPYEKRNIPLSMQAVHELNVPITRNGITTMLTWSLDILLQSTSVKNTKDLFTKQTDISPSTVVPAMVCRLAVFDLMISKSIM